MYSIDTTLKNNLIATVNCLLDFHQVCGEPISDCTVQQALRKSLAAFIRAAFN